MLKRVSGTAAALIMALLIAFGGSASRSISAATEAPTLQATQAATDAGLGTMPQPERVEMVESMPRSTLGKIDRKAMRGHYREGRRKV